jgi:phage major head subunit gpT-like protein
MLPTPENIDAMFVAFSTVWQAAFDEAKVWSDALSTDAPSNTETNTYAWMTQLPRMKRWLSERQIERIAAYSYSLTNEDWELTHGVPRNKVDDDQYGVFAPIFKGYGEATKKWPDDMILEVLEAGEDTLCFDGSAFFDDEHPVDMRDASKGTYSNLLTSKALTRENYADARRKMRLFKGDNGKPLGVRPTILAVPTALEDRARQIVETNDIAVSTLEGQTQVGATENLMKGTATVLVIEELEDQDDWYLFDCSRAVKPFVRQIRKAPAFQRYFNPADPNLFLLKEYLMGADARGAAGVTLPFLAMKCKA